MKLVSGLLSKQLNLPFSSHIKGCGAELTTIIRYSAARHSAHASAVFVGAYRTEVAVVCSCLLHFPRFSPVYAPAHAESHWRPVVGWKTDLVRAALIRYDIAILQYKLVIHDSAERKWPLTLWGQVVLQGDDDGAVGCLESCLPNRLPAS